MSKNSPHTYCCAAIARGAAMEEQNEKWNVKRNGMKMNWDTISNLFIFAKIFQWNIIISLIDDQTLKRSTSEMAKTIVV